MSLVDNKEDQITEANIRVLVDRFYGKIRVDELLGPIFNNMIGVTDEDWEPHLEKICRFWSSIMLVTGTYKGNPLQKHKDIPSFDIALFDRWLTLFAQTTESVYVPNLAEKFQSKSQLIARSLKLGVYGYS